jgi:hypothetical protein
MPHSLVVATRSRCALGQHWNRSCPTDLDGKRLASWQGVSTDYGGAAVDAASEGTAVASWRSIRRLPRIPTISLAELSVDDPSESELGSVITARVLSPHGQRIGSAHCAMAPTP